MLFGRTLVPTVGSVVKDVSEASFEPFYAECACYDKKSSDAHGKNVQSSLHSEEVIKLGCSTIWFAQLQ